MADSLAATSCGHGVYEVGWDLLEQFEVAWRGGAVPRIEDYLLASTSGDRASDEQARASRLLEEFVKIDLEYRWRWAGRATGNPFGTQATDRGVERPETNGSLPDRPRKLEDYLARYPDLGTPERFAADLIGEEYRVRRRGAMLRAARSTRPGSAADRRCGRCSTRSTESWRNPPQPGLTPVSTAGKRPPPGPPDLVSA